MNKPILSLAVATLSLGLCYSIQDKKAPDAAAGMQMPKAGPEHAMLQKFVGNWEAVVIAQDEKGAEQKSKGTTTITKHGGFHTIQTFQGEFMGMPFVGHGVNGYCPIKKQYFTFWSDSMAASPLMLTGSFDAAKKELTLTGEGPGMSGALEKFKTVTRYPDADHMSWALFGAGPDGKDMKHLAIEYTRKK